METREEIVKIISETALWDLLNVRDEIYTFTQSRKKEESEIILDYHSTENLVQEFFQDFQGPIDDDLLMTITRFKINEQVKTYQQILHRYTVQAKAEATDPNLANLLTNGGLAGLVAKLNGHSLETGKDLKHDQEPLMFGSQIFNFVDFFHTMPQLEQRENTKNYIYNGWQFGDVENPSSIDTLKSRREFFERMVLGDTATGKRQDPHFLTEYLADEFIFDTRRNDPSNAIVMPFNSKHHLYFDDGSAQTGINQGRVTRDRILERQPPGMFDKDYVIRQQDVGFYKYPGFTFNYKGLEIDYVQLYQKAKTLGLSCFFYDFQTGKPVSVKSLNDKRKQTTDNAEIYPKRQIVFPTRQLGPQEIEQLLEDNYLHPRFFIYFPDSKLVRTETGEFSRDVLKLRNNNTSNNIGLKFICENLVDLGQIMELFGLTNSDLVTYDFSTPEGQLDYGFWDMVKTGFSNYVSKALREPLMITKPRFMPSFPIADIFKLTNSAKVDQFYRLPYNLKQLDPLGLKIVLETTTDNGQSYYRQSRNNYLTGQKNPITMLDLFNDASYNTYYRLNNSRYSKMIKPKKEETQVEFDWFPGFDKKSTLKFSGINLVAKWERDRMRQYRRRTVQYEQDYLAYSFIDTLIENFLLNASKVKLIPEQINLLRWLTYFELKKLPLSSIKWDALKVVNGIEDIRRCPPVVTYFYYLIVLMTKVTVKTFKKLHQIMISKKIPVQMETIQNFLMRNVNMVKPKPRPKGKPEPKSAPVRTATPFTMGTVFSNVLMDYEVLETKKELINDRMIDTEDASINFYYPDRILVKGPIYLDETKTINCFFREGTPLLNNISYNLSENPNVKYDLCYLTPTGEFKVIKFNNNTFRHQNMNIILHTWLNCLSTHVIEKDGDGKKGINCSSPEFIGRHIFGPIYSQISSPFFKNFLEFGNFLTMKDIFLFMGSFWYIFLNSHKNMKFLPIYWSTNDTDTYKFSQYGIQARLNIGPWGVKDCKNFEVDTSKHELTLGNLITQELDFRGGTTVSNLDKQIKQVGQLDFTNMTPFKLFNVGYQNIFYQEQTQSGGAPIEEPSSTTIPIIVTANPIIPTSGIVQNSQTVARIVTTDPELLKVEREMIFKNEFLEPVGNSCPKMYSFNRFQDYLQGSKLQFAQFFDLYTKFNPIFSDDFVVNSDANNELNSILQLAGRQKVDSKTLFGLKIDIPKCTRQFSKKSPNDDLGPKSNNVTSTGGIKVDPQETINEFNQWLFENNYITSEIRDSDASLLSSSHQTFYGKLIMDSEDSLPQIFLTLNGSVKENDRGNNFSKIFSYNPENNNTAYNVGQTILNLDSSATIMGQTINLAGSAKSLYNHDHEIYNRLIGYFKYWQTLANYPTSINDYPILQNAKKITSQLIAMSESLSDIRNFADNFLRILILTILPTGFDRPEENILYLKRLLGEPQENLPGFADYINKMEKHANSFSLTQYKERRDKRELDQLNSLITDNEYRRYSRMAPSYLKGQDLFKQLYGATESTR